MKPKLHNGKLSILTTQTCVHLHFFILINDKEKAEELDIEATEIRTRKRKIHIY